MFTNWTKSYTLSQAATKLGISEKLVREKCEAGELNGGYCDFIAGNYAVWLRETVAEQFQAECEAQKRKQIVLN